MVGGGQWMVENSNLTKVGEIVLLDVVVSMGHLVGTENEIQRSCAAERDCLVRRGGAPPRRTVDFQCKGSIDPLQKIAFGPKLE